MKYTPSLRAFKQSFLSGRRVPVAACLPLTSDARTLFEAIAFKPPHLLLESARVHPVTGRYSLILGEPVQALTAFGSRAGDPFRELETILKENAAVRLPGLPPFIGGAAGVIGFEAARLLERVESEAEDDLHLPDLAFLSFDEAVVLDHLEEKLWVIALARKGKDPAKAYDEAVSRVDRLIRRVARRAVRPVVRQAYREREVTSTHTRASFEAMVRRAKAHIAAGDIYQANLSQRFSVPMQEEPWSFYRRLSAVNPSPFAAFADFGEFQIVSASPERFIRTAGSRIETRPIAGTRPRGDNAVQTARLRNELILNEKERAEHLMLVDLERNDLGRVCRYDTVEVDDLMALEEYSHVIHIVSNVRGRLRRGVGFRELMAATFPGGTISGCPKLRCLEIIGELERVRRHFYTGSLGYISYTGDMDLNLLIRTAVLKDGQAHVQAGAGIVADSDPGREYEETLHKARALLETLTVRPSTGSGRTVTGHAERVEA